MVDEHRLYQILKAQFGYDHFRDGQLETIQSLLAGKDTLAILPTGAGKSLLYQLPAYLIPGSVVVVSPLLSLMQDQVDRLRQRGEKRVVMLTSQLVGRDRQEVFKHLQDYRFIFTSPEMLTNPQVLGNLQRIQVALLVIDEVHCISQWGPDFRPEYLLLKQVHQLLAAPLLLLTATATPQVRQDILTKLGLVSTQVHQVIRSVNRPNIFLACQRVANQEEKDRQLAQLVTHLPGPGVIYFSSRKLASQVAAFLQERTNIAVAAYHAGLSALERFRIQRQFMDNRLQVICATSAFGMGVDKDDIRYVIHYHLPANLESYMQEIGRAGRDGQQSVAIILYAPGDEAIQSRLTTIELPSVGLLQQVQQKRLPVTALGDHQELFTFYLDHGYQPEQIIAAFRHRRTQLTFSLQKMIDYVGLKACRRGYLLKYFGEEIVLDHQDCCDVDQPTWQVNLELPDQQLPSTPVTGFDWEERLKKLFNIN